MTANAKEAFRKICAFCADYAKDDARKNNDPRCQAVLGHLEDLKTWIEEQLPDDQASQVQLHVSRGQGNFPKVPWISIVRRGHRTSRGVQVAICFGRHGDGAVCGFADSVTERVGLPTVKRDDRSVWKIDVDGINAGRTRFNDAFVNPVEFYPGDFSEDAFISHLKESLSRCLQFGEFQDDVAGEDAVVAGTCGDGPERRALFSLLSKPFLILTGNSGTGKTRLAENVAGMFGVGEESGLGSNSALVAVGADWTDNRSVVGFVNHLRQASLAGDGGEEKRPVYQSTAILDLLLRASEHPDLPHFLILDEMNLSHVERYLADLLSAMETRDGVIRLHSEGPREDDGFRLPRFAGDTRGVPREIRYPTNLFIIGTVNVDETTYMFSPKVLDRAHVIEFEVKREAIGSFLRDPRPMATPARVGERGAREFVRLSRGARMLDGGETIEPLPEGVGEEIAGALEALLDILQRGRFEFGFRTASEVVAYLRVARRLSDGAARWDEGGWRVDLDDAILQKILPRLHGSRTRIGPLLGALGEFLRSGESDAALRFFASDGEEIAARQCHEILAAGSDGQDPRYPRSLQKIRRMIRIVIEEQFVSFIC